ncbi:hydrolase [Gammaproteobacteria bacterium]|jgi:glyoxylase-like metal-dependent hydrolase (beta-lactamase superfamily II)|nr:hydrolase [Gammaproteobacteria bacterium]
MGASESKPASATMIGLRQPEVAIWSERVCVALGMNPGIFTGPGTNTYLVGTGKRRILIDTGQGRPEYLDVLERAIERAGAEGLQEIVLTHSHSDHVGGIADVLRRFGPLRVSKLVRRAEPFVGTDLVAIRDGDRIATEGATLRALFTPGHADDHLCFALEEEPAIFSGDNVLGVGTTVIPVEGGDLGLYMASLERLLAEPAGRIYPAHGPCIEDGPAKLREYLAHRLDRERQILAALRAEPEPVIEIVRRVYTDVPAVLHAAAAQSVTAHLRKLEAEGRAERSASAAPLDDRWRAA